MLLLKILGAVFALALGIWLGRPGRYEQSVSDIEELLGQPGRAPRKAKRHARFDPMAWFNRRSLKKQRGSRARFRLATPDERE